MTIKCIICLLLAFGLYQGVPTSTKTSAQSTSSQEKSASESNSDFEQRRMQAILRARSFVERLFEFRDLEARTLTLIKMGRLLWEHDEPYARQIFIRTYESLKSLAPADDRQKPLTPEADRMKAKLADLSSTLIATLSSYDAALAQKLTVIGGGSQSNTILKINELSLALQLLKIEDNPTKAIELGERALRGDLSQASANIMFLLQELRLKDEAAANKLFLRALQNISAQSIVPARALMNLGTYIFANPQLIRANGSNVIRYTMVGNALVANLSGDWPNVPPVIVKAYLNTAIEILLRPPSDLGEKSHYYAIGYQLITKAERFAPELLPKLRLALNHLSPDVPPIMTQPSTYAHLEKTGAEGDLDLAAAVSQTDKIPDERVRDLTYFRMAHSQFIKGDLAGARSLAERMKDLTIRSRVINLINSSEVVKAVERDEIALAQEIVSKLVKSDECALAWLEVGHAWAEKGDYSMAREAISEAVKAAISIDIGKRPFILLVGAKVIARFDEIDALSMLNDTVKAFNAGESTRDLWSRLWRQEVKMENISRSFTLPRKSIDGGLASVFGKLASINSQRTEEAALTLKPEQIAGEALVGLASVILEEIKIAETKRGASRR